MPTKTNFPFLLTPLSLSICIFVVSLLGYAFLLHDAPFFTRGEAREALVVEAMVEKNNLILPVTNAQQISAKPPMFHWLAIGLSKITGNVGELTIRLPSVLTAAITLSIFFFFLSSVAGIKAGIATIAILGTTIEWVRSASHARVDMCLVFGLVLALLSAYQLLYEGESWGKRLVWIVGSILGIIVAVLSKGPMGLLIPLAVIGVYALVTVEKPRIWQLFSWKVIHSFLPTCLAFAIGGCIAGLWYIFAYQQMPDEFLRVHFVNENLARFMEVPNYVPGHRKPFYYGFIYLFTSFLPWTFFSPLAGIWLWRKKSGLLQMKSDAVLFCLCWIGVIFTMCFAASAKRSVYFLPAFPPLAYLLARSLIELEPSIREFRKTVQVIRGAFLVLLSIFGLSAVLLAVLTVSDSMFSVVLESPLVKAKEQPKIELIRGILQGTPSFFLILPAALISLYLAWKWLGSHRILQSAFAIALTVVFCSAMLSFSVIPSFAHETSAYPFMHRIDELLSEKDELFQYRDIFYTASYYGSRVIPRIDNVRDIVEDGGYLLVGHKELSRFKMEMPDAQFIAESDPYGANGRGVLTLFRILPRQFNR